MILDEFKNAWERLVDKRFAHGYHVLTPNERVWYNTQAFIQSTKREGILGYYYNTNVSILDTVEDLKLLNSQKTALIVEDFNKIFPDSNSLEDTYKRNSILDSVNKQKLDELISNSNGRLTNSLDELEKKLKIFIVDNRLA
jgi:hypothetical protein